MPAHDQAHRRKSKRKGRETGCWVYIPGAELERAGFVRSDPPPYYRVWPGRKRTFMLQLYRDP